MTEIDDRVWKYTQIQHYIYKPYAMPQFDDKIKIKKINNI